MSAKKSKFIPIKKRLIEPEQLSNVAMVSGLEGKITEVIDFVPVVKRWVGIGWVDEGEPTAYQIRTLPVVNRSKPWENL